MRRILLKIQLPENVQLILDVLNKNGYEGYIVGGCVRDSLLGLIPNDWDVCTNALPEKVKECFSGYNIFDAGIKHGTISVVIDKEIYEITTFRIDGEYTDNRHPDKVIFTDDVTKDLSRRDFTINSIAYNDTKGIIDPFNGIKDLKENILRCVGVPDNRFNEDALRILRALRFASTYNFTIDKDTSTSILKNSNLLSNIAYERIQVEFDKLLCGQGAELILNEYREVFAVIIPELRVMFNYNQNNIHHNRLLWEHTIASVSAVKSDPLLKMTMLLHDLGKPQSCKTDEKGVSHFWGHQDISASYADNILRRLKYSNAFIADCVTLIKYHDVRFDGNKRHIKRVAKIIGINNMHRLFAVQYADIMAQSNYKKNNKLELLEKSKVAFDELINKNSCFSLKQLDINGNDLIELGVKKGKRIGEILDVLLDAVIEEKLKNEKSVLLREVEKILNK